MDHKILLSKVKELNIDGKILRWLKDFLSEREQTVVIEGHRSDRSKVISGVPQGTVLGPLLFIIMINDLPGHIKHCSVRSFADDTKLSKVISSNSDFDDMEVDLKSTYRWAENINLPFNSNKFKLLRYTGTSRNDIDTSREYPTPDNSTI